VGENHGFVINLSSVGVPVMTTDELARRRFDRQVSKLQDQLKTLQTVVYGIDQIEDIGEWRRAARAAGRRLGIPVRTGVSRDGTKVWASEGP
jgi:predicted nucleic acid-binding protein